MKFLSVLHPPVFGGPHNQLLRLASALADRGWEGLALLPGERGNAVPRLSEAGIQVVTVPLGRLRATLNPITQARIAAGFWSQVQAIRKVIREYNIDLVQLNGLVNPHGAIAARLEDRPVVWQILDTRPPISFRRLMMPVVVRLADTVMSTGVGVAQVHPGALELGERLVTYFPPVDTRAFQPNAAARRAARAQLGVPDDALLVGSVGNLNPQKGHEYLVRAASLMSVQEPQVYVRVLGASHATHIGYEARLRREAFELGLLHSGRVGFRDPEGRVGTLLTAFDVFVLSSVPRSEGIPTVILEAMACGLPVVSTDVGGVREVVEDGATGLVVPPQDPVALARAVCRLLGNADLRHCMGMEARRQAVERYDTRVCAETHVRAFDTARAHWNRHRSRRSLCPVATGIPE